MKSNFFVYVPLEFDPEIEIALKTICNSRKNAHKKLLGKIKFGLYGYVVPGTVRNFCTFADGWQRNGNQMSYEG